MTHDIPLSAALRAAAGNATTLLNEKLRPLGLTAPQVDFLATFDAHPEYCGAQAAAANHVTPQTGTTIIANLKRHGLIKARYIRGEGRRHTITVTPSGRRALEDARAAVAEVEARLAEVVGDGGALRIRGASETLGQVLADRPKHHVVRAAVPKGRQIKNSAPADKLLAKCRAWAEATDSPGFVPEYVAAQFGTQAQIDQLVAVGAFKPDGNGFRITD